MLHDPFYKDIIEALNGDLDPVIFESCAVDLINRFTQFSVVPIVGGTDSGMDGAVGDGIGEPYPLVCTTSQDVIGNLENSLKSYVEHGELRKVAISVTSQELTPRRSANLRRKAQELGFVLLQVFDQRAIAPMLYRSPEWCRELLHLTGQPSSLSILPRSTRPFIDTSLVGREADLAWLAAASGDHIVVGQPGSGKTYLVFNNIKENNGLFLVSHDETAIAAAIRTMIPKLIVVDDAHDHIAEVTMLKRLRAELGAEFTIILICWPGEKDRVIEAINVSENAVLELEQLTRDEIVEVIKSAGIFGPNTLVREIVNQANGLPGLAVTLTALCLTGAVREVALGNALARSVKSTFGQLIGDEALPVLASLALGGDDGVELEKVAVLLGVNRVRLSKILIDLAAGGVIAPHNSKVIVQPSSLRHALIRDIFFGTFSTFDIKEFINQSSNLSETVIALIGARSIGASVSDDFVIPLLEKANSMRAWKHFAGLGKRECELVYSLHPELIEAIVEPALYHAPQVAIPFLLDKTVSDQRPQNSNLDHPCRVLEDWIESGNASSLDGIQKRRTLIEECEKWFVNTPNLEVTLQGMSIALSPSVSGVEQDPGSGTSITFITGHLPLEMISMMPQVWQAIHSFITRNRATYLQPLFKPLREWAYPALRSGRCVPEDYTKLMHDQCSQMLNDLSKSASDSPGTLHKIDELAQHIGQPIGELVLDPRFELLYKRSSHEEMELDNDKFAKEITSLAREWGQRQPKDVASDLSFLENEAKKSKISWPRRTTLLSHELAEVVADLTDWVDEFINENLPSDIVQPFLYKMAQQENAVYAESLEKALNDEHYWMAAAEVVLTALPNEENLVGASLSKLSQVPHLMNVYILRGQVNDTIIVRMLNHSDSEVAFQAAISLSDQRGIRVPDEAKEKWRSIIITSDQDDYSHQEILKADKELAFEWMKHHINKGDEFLGIDRNIASVTASLNDEQRLALLLEVRNPINSSDLVSHLVNGSIALFTKLLEIPELKDVHLAPLSNVDSEQLPEWIQLATSKGHNTEDIVSAVLPGTYSWTGDLSDMWEGKIAQYTNLLNSDDPVVQEIARRLIECATSERDRMLKRQKRRAITGN